MEDTRIGTDPSSTFDCRRNDEVGQKERFVIFLFEGWYMMTLGRGRLVLLRI